MYYNGTVISVNNSTTTVTFTAPSLPDGVFSGTVVAMVTAVNKFGVGLASNHATAFIGNLNVTILLHMYVRACRLHVK